jgi:hypothetical protein
LSLVGAAVVVKRQPLQEVEVVVVAFVRALVSF